MFCSECGTNTAGAKFCPECGTSVEGSAPIVAQHIPHQAKPEVTQQVAATSNSNNALKAFGFIVVILVAVIYFAFKIAPHNAASTSTQDVSAGDTTVSEPSAADVAKESVSNLSITQVDGRWPTMCEEVMGAGWSCWVDLKVMNNGNEAWDGHLTGELVSSTGGRSASSDSSDVSELTGDFWVTLNPSTPMEWAVYFAVGPDQKFTSLDILADGEVVQSIPICIGSSYELAQGC